MNLKFSFLDSRPIIIALAGSNGAGKSTFYETYLAEAGLRFVNADRIAAALNLDAYEASRVATEIREMLVSHRESFIFETVLSDPVGEKVAKLAEYAGLGYTVAMIFVQLNAVEFSLQRVAIRVSQGGHDVPDEKLRSRFDRTLKNLDRAIETLPHVLIFDNSDWNHPYRFAGRYEHGRLVNKSPEGQ